MKTTKVTTRVHPMTSAIRRFPGGLFLPLLSAALLAALTGAAKANEFVWTGAAGTWDYDTGNTPWINEYAGPSTYWIDGNFATFDNPVTNGLGSTVTVATTITNTSIIAFEDPDWILTGGTLTMTDSTGRINAIGTGGKLSTINSTLTGTVGLTKLRAGTLVLGGTNTYTGSTTISAGSLRAVDGVGLPNASSTGGGSYLIMNGGDFQSSGTFTRANNTTVGSGNFKVNGNLNASFSAYGAKLTVTISGDKITKQKISGANGGNVTNGFRNLNFFQGTGNLGNAEVEFQNDIDMLGGTRVIDVAANASSGAFVTLSGVISNGGLGRQGIGKMVLTGENTYSLLTTLNNASAITVLGNKLALGTSVITITGGGIIQAGTDLSGANKISNAVNHTGGTGDNKFIVSGTNNLDIGGDVTNNGGNKTLTSSITGGGLLTLSGTIKLQEDTVAVGRILTIAGTGNTTITGLIVDGGTAGASGITYNNSGTTTVTNDNTYTGATTVSAGTVLVNGDQSLATGAVNVNGTSTLGGSGTIGGTVTVATTANLAPGASVGTLHIGGGLDISLPADNTGMLDFQLNTIAASDKIAVTGTLTIGTDKLGLNDFNFTDLGGLEDGDYTLISSGTLSGSLDPTDVDGMLGSATIKLKTSGNNIVLAVSGGGGNPYDTWKTQITNGQDLRTDDADGDGFLNIQEFLFGTSPIAGNGALVTTTTSGGNLILRWLQRETGATYTLKQSPTLEAGSWTTAAQSPEVDGNQSGAPTDYDYYTVTIPTDGGKLFFRIEGVEN